MSKVHVMRLRSVLERTFENLIDVSDVKGGGDSKRDAFLTRSQAAYALSYLARIEPEKAAKFVTDGYKDGGIDALYVCTTNRVVYMVQSKWSYSGNGSLNDGDMSKLTRGCKDLLYGHFNKFNNHIRALRADIQVALESTDYKFVYVIVYTGTQSISPDTQTILVEHLEWLNDGGELATYKALNLRDLYQIAGTGLNHTPIEPQIELRHWGHVEEPHEAYYGQVYAEDIAKWWEQHQDNLFAKNIRYFKGNSDVNSSLQNTLSEAPTQFWYFNNGITLLCSSVEKTRRGPADRTLGTFKCKDVSIVNGAQTVGSIGHTAKTARDSLSKALVQVRIIALDRASESFAKEITRATNNQNRIEKKDFVALDPQQDRIRRDLQFLGVEYVYKSGAPAPKPEDGFTLEDATVALACAAGDIGLAVTAKAAVGNLWEDIEKPPYRTLFHSGVEAHRVKKAVDIMRAVERKLSGIRSDDGKARQVAIHGNRFILHKVFTQIPQEWLDDPETQPEEYISTAESLTEALLEVVVELVNRDFANCYLNSLFKNRTKCAQLAENIVFE